ncbi:Membrane-fusion protein [Vibrio fluvialis PG41]|uniref:Membrane fusion protein (MFP) family protein n=1 Tax=Vibrio fluvialis PG41 TaxID=1336752 RepID=S7HX35_VIBFL|nr:HlyD family type I secretion periplasmic adaptor subunit [Vibrio fluvialis]EPP20217.1 Membrane-fusion protein [Vibrio fluvialis PG41]
MKVRSIFKMKRDEYEFLPAIISIQESPPSPIGRLILWILMIFLSAIIIWSIFAEVDIITSSNGKILPNGKVRVVQSSVSGQVKEIYYREGQFVEKGAVLVSLDKTIIDAEIKKLKLQLSEKTALLNSLSAIIETLKNDLKIVSPKNQKWIPTRISKRNNELFESEIASFISSYNVQKNKLEVLVSNINESEVKISKINETLPIIKKRENSYKELYNKSMGSESEYLKHKQLRIEAEYELQSLNSSIKSMIVEMEGQLETLSEMKSRKRYETHNRISELLSEIEIYKEDLIQKEKNKMLHDIISPISGFVQDLAISSYGESVTVAEDILRVVPNKDELIVEALVPSKDIGFIEKSQDVIIKVDTYDFVKHGYLVGKTYDISNDSIEDEKLGVVFKVKIKIESNKINLSGMKATISSGMSVTVDIKTGKRKIIEFFLNPIKRTIKESVSER